MKNGVSRMHDKQQQRLLELSSAMGDHVQKPGSDDKQKSQVQQQQQLAPRVVCR